jgi:hypothetical protein
VEEKEELRLAGLATGGEKEERDGADVDRSTAGYCKSVAEKGIGGWR